MKDFVFLLLTGLLAAYLCWIFYQRYTQTKALRNLYYLMGFAVLLVSGLLLIFLGLGILSSPYVLTVASLIPLGLALPDDGRVHARLCEKGIGLETRSPRPFGFELPSPLLNLE